MADAQLYEQGIRDVMTIEPYNQTGFNGAEITQAEIGAYIASQLLLSADFEILDSGSRTDNYQMVIFSERHSIMNQNSR